MGKEGSSRSSSSGKVGRPVMQDRQERGQQEQQLLLVVVLMGWLLLKKELLTVVKGLQPRSL